MKLPEYIHFVLPKDGTTPAETCIMQTAYPHMIGKIVKILNQEDAAQYLTTGSLKCQLPGLNVFVQWAGYLMRGNGVNQQQFETLTLSEMAEYYAAEIQDNKFIHRRYKQSWNIA